MKANAKNPNREPPGLIADEVAGWAERILDELKPVMEEIFGAAGERPYAEASAEVAADFTRAAMMVLANILHQELNGQISEARSFELIDAFLSACAASGDSHRLTRDAMETLKRKIIKVRLHEARSRKAQTRNEIINATIGGLAHKAWEKNSRLRSNALGTAKRIADSVNAGLKASNLEPLGVQAIRKRVFHIIGTH